MADASAITALIGPTNTGKTYRAIARMLEHGTGMIGLPLRLLAREVYDKVSAKVGESLVALVTGEEQRIPARPSYWVSTVEAMPVERDVDFVAVDEAQLAANDQRGHVFTSRILSARGRSETWLLGADTMRGVLAELVPTARVVEHPRLSRLAFAGALPLARIPPRSAIVAFSTDHVYEIADRLRARKGGAAVVLGALSPRTRNAQVAMFQAGEVEHLVATDAVGMGLNLDVAHVAFASLRKFDGRDVRALGDAELAQIAGRAGRWIEDGTFGTVLPLELPAASARAIESHRFEPVRRVRWRNNQLDFTSIASLVASLEERPRRPVLKSVFDAEDAKALAHLARRDDVVRAATGEARVRLLWETCTVPDFRKLLFEVHADFLADLYLELVRGERLSDAWIEARVRDLDDTSGDVEALVARIAAVRTWTYVTHRADWIASPRPWQEATSALEDRLSDALHARLVDRFVDARKGPRGPRPRRDAGRAARREPGDRGAAWAERPPVDPSHPFAKLAALRGAAAASAHGAQHAAPRWIDEVIEAPHAALRLDAEGRIFHDATPQAIGALVRGASLALPDARVADADDVGAGARSRLQRRLVAFARDTVTALLGDLRGFVARDGTAPSRALLHRLEQRLGTVRAEDAADAIAALDAPRVEALRGAGIVVGGAVVYAAAGLSGAALATRRALAAVYFGARAVPAPPLGGAVSFAARRGVDGAIFDAIGYPIFGGRAVRADVAERAAARLRSAPPGELPAELATWLGCSARDAARVCAALFASLDTSPGER